MLPEERLDLRDLGARGNRIDGQQCGEVGIVDVEAFALEKQIQGWSRRKREALIVLAVIVLGSALATWANLSIR